jgi:hypothetical protein
MSFDYMAFAIYMKMIANAESQDVPVITESLSPNQISSKQWMIDEMYNIFERKRKMFDSEDCVFAEAEIIGSWFGWPLIDMFEKHKRVHINKYTMWDIDKEARVRCNKYAQLFGMVNRTSVIGKDYWEHNRKGSEADLIINTSSEHMNHTFEWMDRYKKPFYVNNPLVVIQCNNMYHIDEHVACVRDLAQLVNRHDLSELYFSGSQPIVDLSNPSSEYRRFMIIGRL